MRRLFARLKNIFRSNHADLELDRECPPIWRSSTYAHVAQALSPANSPPYLGASTNRSIAIRALRSILTGSR